MIIMNYARNLVYQAGDARTYFPDNREDPDNGQGVILLAPVRADNPYVEGPDSHGWVRVVSPSYGVRTVRALDVGVWVEPTGE